MNHAVIFSHPNPDSYTAAVAHAYRKAAISLGHGVLMRDLYRMKFDPRLGMSELGRNSYDCPDEISRERDLLRDIDVFAFVYPLWLYTPPAMIKGYLERVFGFGFAYGPGGNSANPMLAGRKLLFFTSSGLPEEWGAETGNFEALATSFSRYFASVCGLQLVEHVNFGGLPGASADKVLAHLASVDGILRQHFDAETPVTQKDYRGITVNRPPL
jgi:NAD(P)H dehydrogenase (quinone)